MSEEYLTRKALAAWLGVPVKTLQRLHREGLLVGAPFTPKGRIVLYRKSDVEAYLANRKGAA